MCPLCPHCTDTERPCQDSFGSVAELLGGCAGRADALIGAVECQKTNGSLHFHFFLFVQRLHQFATLQEIAELLKASIVESADLKRFLANMCVAEYYDLEKFVSEQPSIEASCAGTFLECMYLHGRPKRSWKVQLPYLSSDGHIV